MGHTPTPWIASAPDASYHDVIRIFADADPEGALPVAICPQRQSAIMAVLAGETNETTEAAANAARIVAAVNATADFTTEALEQGVVRELVEAAKSLLEGLPAADRVSVLDEVSALAAVLAKIGAK